MWSDTLKEANEQANAAGKAKDGGNEKGRKGKDVNQVPIAPRGGGSSTNEEVRRESEWRIPIISRGAQKALFAAPNALFTRCLIARHSSLHLSPSLPS